MDKDRLIGIYKEWPAHKLLEEYAKHDDYEPVAIDAMKTVMVEKGLIEEMNQLDEEVIVRKETEEKRIKEEELIRKFAYAGNEEEFANQSKSETGIYFEKLLYTRLQLRYWHFFRYAVVILVAIDIFFGLYFFSKDMEGPILILLVLIITTGIVYFTMRSNRTKAVLLEENRQNLFRLYKKGEIIKEIREPFSYSYFYLQDSDDNFWVEGVNNYLVLSIKNKSGSECIELVEASSKTNKITKEWELKSGGLDKFDFHSSKEWLSLRGELKVGVEKVVRILNGLNQDEKIN